MPSRFLRQRAARLFLALWPGGAELDAVVKWQQSVAWPATARPTLRQNIHVTLHFLGPVPRGRLQELVHMLAVPVRPFELIFDRSALWSRGLVVLTASHPPSALLELHAALSERLLRAGLPVESRPYVPHLTLARKANDSVLDSMHARETEMMWRVASYVLVESEGGRYTVLARY